MSNMSNEQLIGYCEIHSDTERALFSGKDVNKMLELAGHPKDFVKRVDDSVFLSLHNEMKTLCGLARKRLMTNETTKTNNVYFVDFKKGRAR